MGCTNSLEEEGVIDDALSLDVAVTMFRADLAAGERNIDAMMSKEYDGEESFGDSRASVVTYPGFPSFWSALRVWSSSSVQ